jgi:hypothetical protein
MELLSGVEMGMTSGGQRGEEVLESLKKNVTTIFFLI